MLSVADATKSLLAETKKLLDSRGQLTLREIAEAADVGLEWLRKFHYEGIDKPEIARVERVHTYLSQHAAARNLPTRPEARPE